MDILRILKSWIIIFMLVVSVVLPVATQPAEAAISVEGAYQNSGKYIVKTIPNPTFGHEWFIVGLARGNYPVPSNYFEKYYKNLVKEVQAVKGNLHDRKYTEYSRVILALSAIGKDARDVGGYNLLEKLADFDKVTWQGVNGPIFALIALDSWQYDLPKNASNSREKMIDTILSKQLEDGGFALSGKKADPDMTGMAIQALSTYKDRKNVAQAIERAVEVMSQIQTNDGAFESWGIANSESAAQVLTALASLNIEPTKDPRFTKVLPRFLDFYNETDGGFKHALSEATSDGMSTEQAHYTLAALLRMKNGQTKFYDMKDTKSNFSDTLGHWAKDFIDEAVSLQLLNGYPDGTFKPNVDLTRAQAASLIVRALKLEAKNDAPFTDIASYLPATAKEIAAAYEAGIVKGSNGKFNPSAKVTRAQLALMLSRAYTHQKGEVYKPQQSAPFSDIGSYDTESVQAITMLYDFGIVSGENGRFKPGNSTMRAHAAKIFVNFYKIIQ